MGDSIGVKTMFPFSFELCRNDSKEVGVYVGSLTKHEAIITLFKANKVNKLREPSQLYWLNNVFGMCFIYNFKVLKVIIESITKGYP